MGVEGCEDGGREVKGKEEAGIVDSDRGGVVVDGGGGGMVAVGGCGCDERV